MDTKTIITISSVVFGLVTLVVLRRLMKTLRYQKTVIECQRQTINNLAICNEPKRRRTLNKSGRRRIDSILEADIIE